MVRILLKGIFLEIIWESTFFCLSNGEKIIRRKKTMQGTRRSAQTAMMLAQSGSNAGNTKNFLGILAEVQMDGHLPSGIDLLSWD